MFDLVSAEQIRGGTLFNHQRVTDVCTNCTERHRQVRMVPLLVSSLLSAADFPHSSSKCPPQYSSKQILRLPHLNLSLCSPRPNPQLRSPSVPSLFSLLRRRGSAGTHPELSILQSQPSGPGAGEGQIKACLASSFFPCAHLKSASQRGCVVPSSRLPLATPYSPIRGTGPP